MTSSCEKVVQLANIKYHVRSCVYMEVRGNQKTKK